MYEKKALLTFYALTPVHMGAGQSVSYVDLPVQRERHTEFPTLWSSGIKGVLRDLASRKWNNEEEVKAIFGPDTKSNKDFASCITITDAKILLFPVRSLKGVFAWITCPFVLKRFQEELQSVGIHVNLKYPEPSDNEVIVFDENLVFERENTKKVALEEFVFNADIKDSDQEFIQELLNFLPKNNLIDNLNKHLAIVSDDVFKDFVKNAVEIRTRIRIDQETGTVKEGALFTEELIPSDSVFYSLLFVKDPFHKIEKLKSAQDVYEKLYDLILSTSVLQLGGDDTLGRGIVKVKMCGG